MRSETSEHSPDSRERRRQAWLRVLCAACRWMASVGIVGIAALLFWTERPYLLDLLAQFGVFLATGTAAAALCLVALRRDAAAIVACIGAAGAWGVVLTDYHAPGGGLRVGPAVRIAVFNAHGHEFPPEFIEWVESEQIDILCVLESPPSLFVTRASPAASLPHALPAGPSWRSSNSVYSRFPLEVIWPLPEDVARRRVLAAAPAVVRVDLGEAGKLLLTTQHPPSPRTRESWRRSWEGSSGAGDRVRSYIESEGLPAIVAGDMNSTPTGRTHRAFARASGMRGWTPLVGGGTWPASMPRWASLPIDRIWTTPGASVTAYRVGPAFASDHRPIAATVSFPAR